MGTFREGVTHVMNTQRRRFLAALAAAPLAQGAQAAGESHPVEIPGGLSHLFLERRARRRRSSSYDRTGGNADGVPLAAGARHVLADLEGPGCIRHIWITLHSLEEHYLRRCVLRAWWEGEEQPSIECPIADFFGVGHGGIANFWSLPLNMVTGGDSIPKHRAAMNCFFPMPFARSARIEVENQGTQPLRALYYYVDWEQYDRLPERALRFHAQWRRQFPFPAQFDVAKPVTPPPRNPDGKHNYVILEATGRGHYVGCVLSVDHINPHRGFSWFGEGDDMIFIDGEEQPSLHGTGTEDYFCAAWGFPGGAYSTPYHGVSLAGTTSGHAIYSGKWSMYRFHIEDPICFEKSIRVTIESGHANVHANDLSSVAYWYQHEPHAPFPALPPVEQRLPLPELESLRRFWKTL
jgi:hypothetical protein